MILKGKNILITGGATGIGLALAKNLSNLGNTVIVCGRRQQKLEEAKQKIPSLNIRKCDITNNNDRVSMYKWIDSSFGGIDILVNNAGIQRYLDMRERNEMPNNDEIEINFSSLVNISYLFLPMLMKRKEAAIINVSSGLGFVPLARFAVYSATKAAVHSFTMSLRHQMKDTCVKVYEIIPPIVHDTELKGKPIEKTENSVSSDEVADAVVDGISNDMPEIAVGTAKRWHTASKSEAEEIFRRINS